MTNKPKPQRERVAKRSKAANGRRYSAEEKKAALASLLANNGNLAKTARETGISRNKLREWQGSDLASSPELITLKKELQDSYRAKLKQAREAALDRMLELLPQENDLHKVTGAAKILSELHITEEVVDDISNRPANGIPAASGPAPVQNAGATLPN